MSANSHSKFLGFQTNLHIAELDSDSKPRVCGMPSKKVPVLTAHDLRIRGITPELLQQIRNSVDLSKR